MPASFSSRNCSFVPINFLALQPQFYPTFLITDHESFPSCTSALVSFCRCDKNTLTKNNLEEERVYLVYIFHVIVYH